jgi:hypothetical protein
MNAFKLKVANEEESRNVQEHAFKLGYGWGLWGTKIMNTKKECLFLGGDSSITYSDLDFFDEVDDHQEISVEGFLGLINCDIAEKTKEKVYCSDCVHCKKSIYETSIICLHPESEIKTDTAYEVVIDYASIEKFNSNNDCKNFKKEPERR